MQSNGHMTCEKCGRTMQDVKFYMRRDGVRMNMCKFCATQYIDVRKPDTFLWLLKELDVPFVEDEWVTTVKNQYLKNPEKFSDESGVGTYLRKMRLNGWKKYGWEDSEELNTKRKIATTPAGEAAAMRAARGGHTDEEIEAHNAELKAKLEAQEITEAQYKTLAWGLPEMTAQEIYEEMERRKSVEERKNDTPSIEERINGQIDKELEPALQEREEQKQRELEARTKIQVREDYLRGARNERTRKKRVEVIKSLEDAENLVEEEKAEQEKAKKREAKKAVTIPSLGSVFVDKVEQSYIDQLTEDDIQMLALKWGDNYTPREWVRMEDLYRKYANEFDMNIDREETLRKMCKTSIKMDEALDSGDTQSYSKLSQVFDQLRKSAKFTEAQNKDGKEERYLDSIGELVMAVEREGGVIPQFDYKFESTQDKVDLTLKDMKAYTYNLVRNEMGLGDLIESYIEKLEADQKSEVPLDKDLTISREEEEADTLADDWVRSLEESISSEADSLFGGGA